MLEVAPAAGQLHNIVGYRWGDKMGSKGPGIEG